MNIHVVGGTPYVTASLNHNGKRLALDRVVLDTGSGGCVFSANELLQLDIAVERTDRLYKIAGVGGREFVFSRRLEGMAVGDMEVQGFEVQVGAMNYGFPVQGIIGLDFLLQVGAVIDLDRLELFERKSNQD